MKRLAALLVIAITVVSCGKSELGEVTSIAAVRSAVEEAGYNCTDWQITEPDPDFATEEARCSHTVPVLRVHSDPAQIQDMTAVRAMLNETIAVSPTIHLVGPNWSIETGSGSQGRQIASNLKIHLGGTIDRGLT